MGIGVYKIIFPDGQFYIGSAYGKEGFEGRWEKHRKGHRSSPKYLQELVKNYGGWSCAVFIILRETKTPSRALLCEQAYINRNKNNPMFLNHNKNVWKAPDMSGENHPMFGKHFSEEHKRKISEANKGKHLSEETRKKISESLIGKHPSEVTRKKISEALMGKLTGENHPMFGKHLSEETKEKLSEAQRGENHSQAKLSWIQVKEIREKYFTGNYFQKELAEEYNVHKSDISHIIQNKTWVVKGEK
jgi:group I intron endonuclease